MRFSPRWVLVGALAVLGSFWFGLQMLTTAHIYEAWFRYLMMFAFPAATGALLVGFAPMPPWREPLLAVLAAIGVSISLLLASGMRFLAGAVSGAMLQWVVACVGVMTGAAVVRKLAPRFRAGPASIVTLGGMITIGIAIPSFAIESIVWSETTGLVFVTVVASVMLAGFLTQGSISVRRPWLCGAGTILLMLRILARPNIDAHRLTSMLVAGAVLVCLGSVGARLAWRLMVRRGHREDVAVPPAHVS